MTKIYADAGTTWSKVLELYSDEKELENTPLFSVKNLDSYYLPDIGHSFFDKDGNAYKGRAFLMPTGVFAKADLKIDAATGHMVQQKLKEGGIYQNEVVSLTYGTQKQVDDLENATIIDIGSRDLKWISFKDNKYKDLDWNGSCGSVTGATVEMLCKYYNIDPQALQPQKERIPVTCGVFAMEKIMDDIASDIPAEIAIAKYINGIAYNAWAFAKNPNKVYLSGGFCMNKCFVESLKIYCEVIPLGRFVLIEGLY